MRFALIIDLGIYMAIDSVIAIDLSCDVVCCDVMCCVVCDTLCWCVLCV